MLKLSIALATMGSVLLHTVHDFLRVLDCPSLQVHVVVRSPVLLLPRNTFGTDIAPDHKLSRLVLWCPQVQECGRVHPG